MLQIEQRIHRMPNRALKLGQAQIVWILGPYFSDTLSIGGEYSAVSLSKRFIGFTVARGFERPIGWRGRQRQSPCSDLEEKLQEKIILHRQFCSQNSSLNAPPRNLNFIPIGVVNMAIDLAQC